MYLIIWNRESGKGMPEEKGSKRKEEQRK